MIELIFGELDHRLSVVKRWAILHTVQTQSVAEHVFNVERIALRIAKQWFGIDDTETKWQIVKWAHHHDDFEALSGDLSTMVKPYFREEEFEREHEDLIERRSPKTDFVKRIVKLADILERWHFLSMEMMLGNEFVKRHWEKARDETKEYVCNNFDGGGVLWAKFVEPTLADMVYVSTRHSRRGR